MGQVLESRLSGNWLLSNFLEIAISVDGQLLADLKTDHCGIGGGPSHKAGSSINSFPKM
jgi:hypothetical protein